MKDNKVVWIFNHYATTPEEPTTRSYDLGKRLVGKGYRVTIFASSFSHYKFIEKRLQYREKWKIENCNGVNFIWIKTTSYKGNNWRRVANMLSYAWRVTGVGKKLKEKPDVIIGTCVHPFAVLSAYILSIFKKSRFFFEVTDLWPQTLVDMGALSKKSPITWGLRILEKFLYEKAERIITLLPHADDYITSIGIPNDKIVWIPNGVDLSRYENIKPYNGGTTKTFTIMYLGIHARYAGLETVLKVNRILQSDGYNNIKFILVGEGEEKPRLIKLAQKWGLYNTEFRDLVPKSEIFKVMGEADAFISIIKDLPLLKFGISSNKLNDYLASGRPILFAVNASNNPVKEAEAGLTVPPENPKALAQAIVKLISLKPEKRIQMGKNGLEYVKKHHDIRVLADRLERILL